MNQNPTTYLFSSSLRLCAESSKREQLKAKDLESQMSLLPSCANHHLQRVTTCTSLGLIFLVAHVKVKGIRQMKRSHAYSSANDNVITLSRFQTNQHKCSFMLKYTLVACRESVVRVCSEAWSKAPEEANCWLNYQVCSLSFV